MRAFSRSSRREEAGRIADCRLPIADWRSAGLRRGATDALDSNASGRRPALRSGLALAVVLAATFVSPAAQPVPVTALTFSPDGLSVLAGGHKAVVVRAAKALARHQDRAVLRDAVRKVVVRKVSVVPMRTACLIVSMPMATIN